MKNFLGVVVILLGVTFLGAIVSLFTFRMVKEELSGYVETAELSVYAKKTDLDIFATSEDVKEKSLDVEKKVHILDKKFQNVDKGLKKLHVAHSSLVVKVDEMGRDLMTLTATVSGILARETELVEKVRRLREETTNTHLEGDNRDNRVALRNATLDVESQLRNILLEEEVKKLREPVTSE